MTQEELDARIAAGDTTVLPVFDLPREEFVDALTEIVAEAIEDGMDPVEALVRAAALAEEYTTVSRAKTAELN